MLLSFAELEASRHRDTRRTLSAGSDAFRSTDYASYVHEYNVLTALNNLHFQQLEAILELLWNEGMIERPYGLGIVTSAHTFTTSDNKLRSAPATARIVCPGQDGAPELWIHNNTTLGGGDYNH